jgi:hypothetical protein
MPPLMNEPGVSYKEADVPLEGIDRTAEEILTIYGGSVTGRSRRRMDFSLPRRRGVAASGSIAVVLEWGDGTNGEVTISTGEEITTGRGQRIALLAAGVIGACLFILWPYFPGMGALAWIGGLIALGAYFLTLRGSQQGLIYSILQQIVDTQSEVLESEDENENGQAE